jgi:hypothetical protein
MESVPNAKLLFPASGVESHLSVLCLLFNSALSGAWIIRMIRIIPRYKLLMSYDIKPEAQEVYYRYVTTEFVPALRSMQIYMTDVHHTLWGNYPIRLVEFVAESKQIIQTALDSDEYQQLEEKLKTYTENFSRKVIRYRDGFQM